MTDTLIPVISLRSIDAENVEDVPDNEDAVRFQVLLSQAPPETWITEFQEIYHAMPYGIKPPVHIQGESMKIDYLGRYSNELPAYLRFLDAIVHRANEEFRQTQEIASSEEHDTLKARFRETLRGLRLP